MPRAYGVDGETNRNTLFYRFLTTSCATLILAVGCAQNGAQSGNEAQKMKGPGTAPTPIDVSLVALDAEFGTFLRMNPS
jgi:hypothetical protein